MNMASSKYSLVIGYSSAFGKMLTGTSSATCTQALQGAVPDFQLSVARSLVQSVLYIICGKLAGSDFTFKRETFPGLLYLGFLYLVFNVGLFGSTAYLPLTEAYGVLVIASIVASILQSRLFFYIDITKIKVISLFVCVIGIVMAAQPSWLFNHVTTNSKSDFENTSHAIHRVNVTTQFVHEVIKGEVLLGYILSVIGGVACGLMYDINGIMLKGIEPIVKITYAAIFCTIWSVAFMFYMEDPVLVMDLTQFMLVLGHSVLSTVNSFLFVVSGHYIPGPTLSALYSLQMVIYAVYQYTLMHSIQPGNYNWIELLGCAIITFGGSIPSVVDTVAHRAKSNELP